MYSRILAAARVAAARFAGNCRAVGSLPVQRLSFDESLATLKREIMHPETRPENMG